MSITNNLVAVTKLPISAAGYRIKNVDRQPNSNRSLIAEIGVHLKAIRSTKIT
ncbi:MULTISPECIES: hypothetical protein [unclassified Chamaesiphon]|uniref:hypothetical protein n=1 Tax=unclassified Chamaesiphon TaxID=2620921 RepID=UPI002869F75D|nr:MULTISPECIES: hypothetical protein [unclassified Chamaesiphon]